MDCIHSEENIAKIEGDEDFRKPTNRATARKGFFETLRNRKNAYSMDMGMAKAEYDQSLPKNIRKEEVRMYVICAEKAS